MKDNLVIFSKFSSSFNKNEEIKIATQKEIEYLEAAFRIKLPEDFKLFIQNYGNLWTPDILNIIEDNEVEMNDILEFWSVEEIIDDKKSGFTSQVDDDLIPFASDCMGNIYAFKSLDLRTQKHTAKVVFFDHDFDEVTDVADSFTALIEGFNSLI